MENEQIQLNKFIRYLKSIRFYVQLKDPLFKGQRSRTPSNVPPNTTIRKGADQENTGGWNSLGILYLAWKRRRDRKGLGP